MAVHSWVLVGEGTLLAGCGDILLGLGQRVAAVVTREPAIERWASEKRIPTHTSDSGLASVLRGLDFDHLASIAHLSMIPAEALGLVRGLAVNFHDGPLPRYAGLNVTSWAILGRETDARRHVARDDGAARRGTAPGAARLRRGSRRDGLLAQREVLRGRARVVHGPGASRCRGRHRRPRAGPRRAELLRPARPAGGGRGDRLAGGGRRDRRARARPRLRAAPEPSRAAEDPPGRRLRLRRPRRCDRRSLGPPAGNGGGRPAGRPAGRDPHGGRPAGRVPRARRCRGHGRRGRAAARARPREDAAAPHRGDGRAADRALGRGGAIRGGLAGDALEPLVPGPRSPGRAG